MTTPKKKTTKVVNNTSKDEMKTLVAKLGIFMSKHDACDMKCNVIENDIPVEDNGKLRYNPSTGKYTKAYYALDKSLRKYIKASDLTESITQSNNVHELKYVVARFPSIQKVRKIDQSTYYTNPSLSLGVRRWSRKQNKWLKTRWISSDFLNEIVCLFGKSKNTEEVAKMVMAIEVVNGQFAIEPATKTVTIDDVIEEWDSL